MRLLGETPHILLPWVNTRLACCLNRLLNVKDLVGTFNQEKALIEAFSVITNLRMDLYNGQLVTRDSKGILVTRDT